MMLEVFVEMKGALLKIDDYLRDLSLTTRRPQNITPSNWAAYKRLAVHLEKLDKADFLIISELCKILKIFHLETCRVCLSKIEIKRKNFVKLSYEQSTASTYLPTVKKILAFLTQKNFRSLDIQFFVDALIKNLRERLFAIESNPLLKMCMIVDPRFSYSDEFLTDSEWVQIEEKFVDFISSSRRKSAEEPEGRDSEQEEIAGDGTEFLEPLEPELFDEDSMDIGCKFFINGGLKFY